MEGGGGRPQYAPVVVTVSSTSRVAAEGAPQLPVPSPGILLQASHSWLEIGEVESPGNTQSSWFSSTLSATRRRVEPPSPSWNLITKPGGTIAQP